MKFKAALESLRIKKGLRKVLEQLRIMQIITKDIDFY